MKWANWTLLVLGVWLIAAPLLLGSTATTAAADNGVIVGLAVLILSVWRALSHGGHGEMPHMAAHH